MSLNLYMEPVQPPERVNLGGHPIKGLICDAFGEHDGSLREDIRLTKENLPELNVLLRTNRRGAQAEELREGIEAIIAAIYLHGVIRLYTDE